MPVTVFNNLTSGGIVSHGGQLLSIQAPITHQHGCSLPFVHKHPRDSLLGERKKRREKVGVPGGSIPRPFRKMLHMTIGCRVVLVSVRLTN